MSEIDDLGEASVIIRPAGAADRAGVVALAPRLAEGTAPWRDQREASVAGRRWLEGSLDDAAAGAWARDHRLARLTLHAGAYNASARSFYAALGFAEEGKSASPARSRPPEPGPPANSRLSRGLPAYFPARAQPLGTRT